MQHEIKIDYKRDELLSPHAIQMLKDFYMLDYEKSPQDAFARAAWAWSTFKGETDKSLAQRLYDAVSRRWFMFASPVLSNAPNGATREKYGLPISCFLTYVPDTIPGLISHSDELRWLSVMGGGVGGHWSDVRTVSKVAPGPIPFLHTVDADMVAYRQGKTRKGSYAAYMDASHPDIMEFLQMRTPTGDTQRKALNLHHAINITDDFMMAVMAGAKWDLRDPKDNVVKETVDARKLFERILETRARTGEPYLNFIDTIRRNMNPAQQALGLKINGSNLCNEIHLVTDEDRSAVCCLSSLNLELVDEWMDSTLVEDMTRMLDNVLEYFIENAPDTISRARYSAMRERSIGLGALGYHYMLQKNGLPFESDEAREMNKRVFETIQRRARTESMKLAQERGEPEDLKGTGMRNAHLIALAPNASSGLIVGSSPSIEPSAANAYTHKTRAGSVLIKNPYLESVLDKLGKNTDEIWSSIIINEGSVQHLAFLDDHTKAVYRTAFEIEPMAIVEAAADRQKFICQGQSVNLFFRANAKRSYVKDVHMAAWRLGVKGLYYYRTQSKARAENVSAKVAENKLKEEARTIIYGTKVCQYCNAAKSMLTAKGIEFEYVDLQEIGKTAAEVTGREDVRSVPQIYLHGKYIGGFNDLVTALAEQINNPETDSGECKACEG